jgi:molybdenum cofactor guanylyltransferase
LAEVRGENQAAIVLAGGQSRRMGQNKALLRLAENAPTLIETVVAKLKLFSAEVIVVTNQPELYQELDFPLETRFVKDNFRESGALGGIEAGLSASHYEYCLTVACDMPFLADKLLDFLVKYNRDGWQALVPLNPMPEPLCALYHKSSLEQLRGCLAQNRFKVQDFLEQIQTSYLPKEEWQWFDPKGQSFRNLNTPDDLARYRLLL